MENMNWGFSAKLSKINKLYNYKLCSILSCTVQYKPIQQCCRFALCGPSSSYAYFYYPFFNVLEKFSVTGNSSSGSDPMLQIIPNSFSVTGFSRNCPKLLSFSLFYNCKFKKRNQFGIRQKVPDDRTYAAMKIPFMYSQKRNCAASVSTFCERFIYSQDRSTNFPAAE